MQNHPQAVEFFAQDFSFKNEDSNSGLEPGDVAVKTELVENEQEDVKLEAEELDIKDSDMTNADEDIENEDLDLEDDLEDTIEDQSDADSAKNEPIECRACNHVSNSRKSVREHNQR